MKEIEKIDVVIVKLLPQKTGFMSRQDLYIIDIDRERNCFNCRDFCHIVRNCKNQRIGQRRQISYQNNNKYLKEKENLVIFD